MAFPTTAQLMPAGDIDPADAKTYFTDWLTATRTLLGDGSTAQVAREALGVALPNWLDNPSGEVYQRTPGATADDAYAADRWYCLTQTGTVTPSQVSNPEDGYRYALRILQAQASAQRMGYAQIIEGKDAIPLRGKTVTFGGRFKLSATQTLRYAILAWTGTEDAPVSDVVNSWTNGTFTAGQFFNSTTMSVVATGSTALTGGTAATCSVSGTVPAGTTNLIVFYWTEATAAQNVTLDAWGLRLVEASSLVDYIKRSWQEELRRCQRFYQSYGYIGVAFIASAGAQQCNSYGTFGVQMRIAPTATVAAATTSTNATSRNFVVRDSLTYIMQATSTASGLVNVENPVTFTSDL